MVVAALLLGLYSIFVDYYFYHVRVSSPDRPWWCSEVCCFFGESSRRGLVDLLEMASNRNLMEWSYQLRNELLVLRCVLWGGFMWFVGFVVITRCKKGAHSRDEYHCCPKQRRVIRSASVLRRFCGR